MDGAMQLIGYNSVLHFGLYGSPFSQMSAQVKMVDPESSHFEFTKIELDARACIYFKSTNPLIAAMILPL